ncbi:hypothetical protein [Paraburkholderia sediminicola]|uniref:hypothetical protein n=1 Tax=Paraburkholderia sediminicola TaxID=458836 RepID=UPI0038B6E94A
MNEVPTLQDRLTVLRNMLDATENLLAPPEREENEATRKSRHAIALGNARQITTQALGLERDLADGLSNEVFLAAILMRYVPDHRGIPGPKSFDA